MVDISSFKTNLDQALSESILSVEENNDHILVDILPTAVVKIATHLKSKKGFLFNTLISLCLFRLSKSSTLESFKSFIILGPIENNESGVFWLSIVKCFSIAHTPSRIDAIEEKILSV